MRKTNVARLLRGRPDGIFVAEYEQDEIGALLASLDIVPDRGVSHQRAAGVTGVNRWSVNRSMG